MTKVNFYDDVEDSLLKFAVIHSFEKELHSEIEKIAIMDDLPENWTYPEIQPKLLQELKSHHKGHENGEI